MDHYTVLQVSQDASAARIRSQYLRLAKENHPDKNPSARAHEKFAAISSAYEVLSDSKLRTEYDRELRDKRPSATSGTTNGRRGFAPKHRRPRKEPVSLEDQLTRWKKLFQRAHEEDQRFLEEEKRGIITDANASLGSRFPGHRPARLSSQTALYDPTTTAGEVVLSWEDAKTMAEPCRSAEIFTVKKNASAAPQRYSMWLSKDFYYLQWRLVGKAGIEPDGGLAVADITDVKQRRRKGATGAGQTLALFTDNGSFNFDASADDICTLWCSALKSLVAASPSR